MDGVAAKGVKRATLAENDVLNRPVIAQHRDENIAVASIGDPPGGLQMLEGVEPLVENNLDVVTAEGDAFSDDESDVNQAVKKAGEHLRRELIDNRGEIDRNVKASIKLASAQMKAQGADIQRAMREAQRVMENIHLECASEMQ